MPPKKAGHVGPPFKASGAVLPFFGNDEDEAAPPRQPRNVRGLLRLLVAIAILSLLGVAAIVIFAMEFGESTITGRDNIADVLRDIADVDVPEGFEPEMAVAVKVLPWRRPVMMWVKFSDKQTDSALVVAQLGNDLSPNAIGFALRFTSQIEESLASHNAKHKPIILLQTDMQFVDSRSQMIACHRGMGKDPDSKTSVRRVTAVFQGRHGPAGVILYADAARYSEETIMKLFKSIRGGPTETGR